MVDTLAMHSSPLEQKIAKEIRSFKELPERWHYGVGVGATDVAVSAALSVNSLMVINRAENIEVFPAVDGSILVSGYCGDDTLEILCRLDGKMDIVYEVGDAPMDEKGNLCMNDIEEYLGGLNWLKQKSSDYYIRATLAKRKDASLAWLFSPHPKPEEYRCSIQNVPFGPAKMNASISINTIGVSLAVLMFSGVSSLDNFQGIAFSLTSHHQQATPAIAISGEWVALNAGT